ncbi:MAG: hypothetical protein OSB57_11290 [Planctomycetota bacterium]|jgi:hypothetical protein|nr:hypothetical protein [Planctomycetota bacterium]
MSNGETFPAVPRIHANLASRRERVLGSVLWIGFLAILFLR